MCLLTKQIMPIKAKKPIVVYKVLLEQKYCLSDNTFITPWMYEKTGLNRLLVATGEKTTAQSGIKGIRVVGSGYIHCYTNIENAKWAMKYLTQNFRCFKTVLIKCIIEPSTRYYKSWNGEEIAADAIFIKEKIL